jgi:hypothetical protein
VFPFTNSLGHTYIATGKNHSIEHTPADVVRMTEVGLALEEAIIGQLSVGVCGDVRYCDAINVSCEAQETAHRNWVKEQGD